MQERAAALIELPSVFARPRIFVSLFWIVAGAAATASLSKA